MILVNLIDFDDFHEFLVHNSISYRSFYVRNDQFLKKIFKIMHLETKILLFLDNFRGAKNVDSFIRPTGRAGADAVPGRGAAAAFDRPWRTRRTSFPTSRATVAVTMTMGDVPSAKNIVGNLRSRLMENAPTGRRVRFLSLHIGIKSFLLSFLISVLFSFSTHDYLVLFYFPHF